MTLARPWHAYVGMEPSAVSKEGPDTVVWLDIGVLELTDNTLYPQSGTKCAAANSIDKLMMDRIRTYFMRLGLSNDEAEELHTRYYRDYGLAIRGLIKHHTIDALDYDAQCDASLPLEDILKPDPRLVALLESLDRSRCRVFALTNAYKTHATRVLKLVGLGHIVDAIIYCDYTNPDLYVPADSSCKPEAEFYHAAAEAVGATDATHYFVDDSLKNVVAAQQLGWRCVHFDERAAHEPQQLPGARVPTISTMLDLHKVWPELFISNTG